MNLVISILILRQGPCLEEGAKADGGYSSNSCNGGEDHPEGEGSQDDYDPFNEDALEQTAQGSRTLAVALNYGSHAEIVQAARQAAAEGEITEEGIARHLYSADLPPLDLLIRTSGEVRLSNFLLWQAAYAEMLFLDVLWPDFTPDHLKQALAEFAERERRFGGR